MNYIQIDTPFQELHTSALLNSLEENVYEAIAEELISSLNENYRVINKDVYIDENEAKRIIELNINNKILKDSSSFPQNYKIENFISIFVEIIYQKEKRKIIRKEATNNPKYSQSFGELEVLWNKKLPIYKRTTKKWIRAGSFETSDCNRCGGGGRALVSCSACKGLGYIERTDIIVGSTNNSSGYGAVVRKEQCISCQAKGQVIDTCPKCSGTGTLQYLDYIVSNINAKKSKLYFSQLPRKYNHFIEYTKPEYCYSNEIDNENSKLIENEKLTHIKYKINFVPITTINYSYKNRLFEIIVINKKPINKIKYFLLKYRRIIFQTIGILVMLFITAFIVIETAKYFKRTNNVSNIKTSKEQINGELIINNLIDAESRRNINLVLSFYTDTVVMYLNKINRSTKEITEDYQRDWNYYIAIDNIKLKIETINHNTFDVYSIKKYIHPDSTYFYLEFRERYKMNDSLKITEKYYLEKGNEINEEDIED
ncbi:MAG: hypothetical protein JNJ58_03505 [Chitinophagaceae bacterium]|nr:hypothetical protein [Chitinophagaceae bacterium]